MKIAIAADHAGYEEKERQKPLLDVIDVTCFVDQSTFQSMS